MKAVLEALTRPDKDGVVVASGFGRTAQWFRNILANPDCPISIGARRRIPVHATVIGNEEAQMILASDQKAHPKA